MRNFALVNEVRYFKKFDNNTTGLELWLTDRVSTCLACSGPQFKPQNHQQQKIMVVIAEYSGLLFHI